MCKVRLSMYCVWPEICSSGVAIAVSCRISLFQSQSNPFVRDHCSWPKFAACSSWGLALVWHLWVCLGACICSTWGGRSSWICMYACTDMIWGWQQSTYSRCAVISYILSLHLPLLPAPPSTCPSPCSSPSTFRGPTGRRGLRSAVGHCYGLGSGLRWGGNGLWVCLGHSTFKFSLCMNGNHGGRELICNSDWMAAEHRMGT